MFLQALPRAARSASTTSNRRSFTWSGRLAAVLVIGVGSAAPAFALSFTKITDAANPIVADPGATAGYFGAAWADYDGDGDIDLFVDTDSFYRNDGGGQFTKIVGSGLGAGQVRSPSFSMSGWSWGDYDRDGDLDAFIAGERSFLYRNDGGDVFTQITTGDIGDGLGNRGWTCAWGDYDNDGNLDLVIVHPAGFIPPNNMPLPNQMLHGDGGPDYTFTEIFSGPIVTGLDSYTVGTWADFDDDGDLDFFIGCGPADGTLQADHLYRNLLIDSGTADFENITESPIATDLQDGQVWNWIDYDNDGDLDAYMTNWGGPLGGVTRTGSIATSRTAPSRQSPGSPSQTT
ncbi:MAG: VCBS repeat-containing protein [Candidatus Eisenbacteria bacterium]